MSKVQLAVTAKGQVVTVLKVDEDLVKVRYANGREGWLTRTDVEIMEL